MRPRLAILLGILIGVGCRSEQPRKPKFEHDITNGPTPWTSDQFELEEEDFTFAIISDLNGGERPGVFSTAVSQLNTRTGRLRSRHNQATLVIVRLLCGTSSQFPTFPPRLCQYPKQYRSTETDQRSPHRFLQTRHIHSHVPGQKCEKD